MNKTFTPSERRRHLLYGLTCLVFLAIPSLSEAFVIDKLEYTITDSTKQEVSVKSLGYADWIVGSLDIPGEVEFEGETYKVTSIGRNGFQYCDRLTSVTIPNTVTIIGQSAFNLCDSIISVTIPNSVTQIMDSAFCGCSSLRSVTIPSSVTEIRDYAFQSCSNLETVDLPKTLKHIGGFAFSFCGLTSITFPDSLKGIDWFAFEGCKNLTSIELPNSVTYIETGAFEYCEGITSLVIPNSVKSIGQRAFYQCYNLTRVYIPISVETIREGAFESCVKLMDPDHPENAIYCEAKEEPEGWILFYGYDFHGLGSKLPLNVHWGTTAGVKFLASTDVEVYGAEQSIAVWNATGEICVLNLAGQIVCQRKAIAPHTVIPVRAGIYVVSVNGVAKKVIVR